MAKTKTIENLFVYLAIATDLLPLSLFFLNFNKCRNEKGIWAIVVYLFFDFFVNLVFPYFFYPDHFDLYIYPLFTLIETLLFSYFFFVTLKRPTPKKIVTVSSSIFAACFIVYYILVYLLSPKPPKLDSIPIGIETLLMIIFLLLYLFEEINDTTTLFVYSKYTFWISIGIVLYLAGSLFTYIFSGFLPSKKVEEYWFLTNLFSILKNALFTISIFIFSKQDKNPKTPMVLSFEHLN